MRDRLMFLAFLHTILLLASIFLFLSMSHVSHAQIINVPQDYPTIGQAIVEASDGYTIQVNLRPGESQSVYYERLVINKQLTLVGESKENVIIDGSEAGTVIRVQADNVEIREFTVRNGGKKYSGIRVESYSYANIINNTIKTNKNGIVFVDSHYNTVVQNQLFNNSIAGITLSSSIGNSISGNYVSKSSYGIDLYSSNTTFVVGNTVTDGSYGIYIEQSSDNTIDNNTLLRNGVSGILPYRCHDMIVSNNEISESAYAIEVYSSDTITIVDNDAMDNSYGLYFVYASLSNTVENNTLSGNDWGIKLYSSSSNTFKGNTISYNTYGVDAATESNSNLFYHNSFVENVEQVVWNPDCINTWDDGYPSGGNYWSDYTGTDSNGDGIGDTAYNIDGVNKDRYPLMNPWGIIHEIAINNVTLSQTFVYKGNIVQINVTAKNEGNQIETFDVTAKYENTTLGIFGNIGTQTGLNLDPEESVLLTFDWNTSNVQPSVDYTIKAEASVVPGEINATNNLFVDGIVNVRMPGDVDGDGDVDIADLSYIARAFGTTPKWPHGTDWSQWNPQADINDDKKVDAKDLYIAASNYGA